VTQRTNAEWIEALSRDEGPCPEALADMRSALERAAMFYIRRQASAIEGIATDQAGALAEDCAQDASLLVLQRLSTFRGEARFLTWAGSFAILRAQSTLRRKRWRDLSIDRIPAGWSDSPAATIPDKGWADPLLVTQRRAIWETIRDVVETDLTPRQREVLNMLVINGASTEDVEAYLQMSPSALYKMTHDARRKLKAGLQARGFTTGEILDAFATEA
jgi:RNA polymerase sigma-70 factor (ECF subfamily)